MARIAVVTTMAEAPWGGSEELWAQMAEEAVAAGHQVLALIPKWDPKHFKVQELESKGILIREWAEHGTHPQVNQQRGLHEVYPYESIVEFAPDVVLVSHGGLQDMVHGHTLLAALLIQLEIPFIPLIQCNTDLSFPQDDHRHALQNYFGKAARVLFVSQGNYEMAERILATAIPNHAVINNPVNMRDYADLGWPEGETARFCCVARLDSHAKGYDVLFEVLGQQKWLSRNWTLDIYGSGVHQQYLTELVQHFKLDKKVTFRGTTKDIRGVWKEQQMLLLASRYEGTPLALYEAMLCGRAAVVTDVGGNSDWVKEGLNGFVAGGAMPKLYDLALERAWKQRHKWRELGEAARNFFLTHHEIKSGRTLLNHILEVGGFEKIDFEPPVEKIVPQVSNVQQREAGKAPRVSVIIPCYNYGDYVGDCIESVMQQSFKDFEVIVVNDGSTDNSLEVALGLAEKYGPKLKVIDQRNSGQPAVSRNTGIKQARGEFVLCVDADDMIDPGMLEKCVAAFDADPEAGLVYTDAIFFDETGKRWRQDTGEYSLELLGEDNRLLYCSMYRRKVWDIVGGYKLNVPGYEDWDYWIACAEHGIKAIKVPEPLLIYREKSNGMWDYARARDYLLRANIVANHPSIYDEQTVEWASEALGRPVQKPL